MACLVGDHDEVSATESDFLTTNLEALSIIKKRGRLWDANYKSLELPFDLEPCISILAGRR
jgi:hypothetical protein